MPGILWLASYPKSGNTWLRAFLANYLHNPEQAISINDLPNFMFGDGLAVHFEKVAGGPVADLSAEDLQRLRPAVHRMFVQSSGDTVFVKTHNAISYIDDIPTITPDATAGAIYIIRNPLDVAVSYAHHYGATADRAIDVLGSDDSMLPSHGHLVVQHLGSWSGHVRSWTTAPGLTPHIMRYEDMARAPDKAFRRLIKFLGLPYEADRLKKAIRFSSFKTLSGQEQASGFVESSPGDDRIFFRTGRTGNWRDMLDEAQVERIIDDHRDVMTEHGYLTKTGRPVF